MISTQLCVCEKGSCHLSFYPVSVFSFLLVNTFDKALLTVRLSSMRNPTIMNSIRCMIISESISGKIRKVTRRLHLYLFQWTNEEQINKVSTILGGLLKELPFLTLVC